MHYTTQQKPENSKHDTNDLVHTSNMTIAQLVGFDEHTDRVTSAA